MQLFNCLKRVARPIITIALLILTNNISYAFEDGVNVYYFLEDHLGGTDVVLNEDFEVVSRYDYMPFGAERVTEGDSKESHRYTGQELDEETGLYYYGARYYDAELGRFISVDPWAGNNTNPQTLNKYSYVVNNPIKLVDPTGEIPRDASILTKISNILKPNTNSSGWLAASASQYINNPSQNNRADFISKQSIALERFIGSPLKFTDETWDSYTNQRIQKLDSRVQIPATDLINTIEDNHNKTFRISDGLRTFDEQNALYEQGRSTPGNIVTNAKGGESYHNYGLAIDIAEIKDGKLSGPVTNAIGQIGKSLGFEWGGDWGWDRPHFEMTFDQSTSTLKKERKGKETD